MLFCYYSFFRIFPYGNDSPPPQIKEFIPKNTHQHLKTTLTHYTKISIYSQIGTHLSNNLSGKRFLPTQIYYFCGMRSPIIQIVTTLILFTVPSLTAKGESRTNSRVVIAFYNTNNLSNESTANSRPDSYTTAIINTANLLDDMKADIVGLCEVGNEKTLQDLVSATKTDYSYIHRETNDPRGADIALLYRTDILSPRKVEQLSIPNCRQALHISATLLFNSQKEELEILVCHMPAKNNSYTQRKKALKQLAQHIDSLRNSTVYDKMIIMGDMNIEPTSLLFKKIFGKHDKAGLLSSGLFLPQIATPNETGTYAFGNRWSALDLIMVDSKTSSDIKNMKCSIFIRDYLFANPSPTTNNTKPYRGAPRSRNHTNGFSDHLPIILKYIP